MRWCPDGEEGSVQGGVEGWRMEALAELRLLLKGDGATLSASSLRRSPQVVLRCCCAAPLQRIHRDVSRCS